MRRFVLSLLAAVFGTALLVGLKVQPSGGTGPVAALDLGADPGSTSPAPGSTASGPPGSPTATAGATTGAPGPTTGTAPTQTRTTTAPPPAPKPSTKVTGSAIAVKTAQTPTAKSTTCGDCHDYTITVTLTITDGKITAASTSYNTSPGASLSYYNRAVSALQPKIVGATTWNLGRVSGATYSGNAWELSAQSAMSKAGLPV
jgi:uncharacterized protein with FMN-binding domain